MSRILDFILKNKITIFISVLILSIWYLIYSNFEANKIKTSVLEYESINPYILVTEWTTIIRRSWENKILKIQQKEKKDIKLNDKIRTLDNSSATIFWPDGSITRLWNKTSITINEIKYSKDLSVYKINFNLENWKTWSNIVKFLTDDSYFTETYEDWNYAATARWTVFEINLDDNYINAYSHDISLVNNSKNATYNIKQWEVVEALKPDNIVWDFVVDKEWEEKNINQDKSYLDSLLNKWENKVKQANNSQTIWTKAVSYIKFKTWINKDDYLISEIINSEDTWLTDELKKLEEIKSSNLNKDILNIYKQVHALPNSQRVANYKSNLRNLIVKTTKKWEQLSELKKKFLKLNIYDYVDLAKNSTISSVSDIKNNIDEYLNEMQDAWKMQELLSSFSQDVLWVFWDWFEWIKQEISEIIEWMNNSSINQKIKNSIIENKENLKWKAQDFINNFKKWIWN